MNLKQIWMNFFLKLGLIFKYFQTENTYISYVDVSGIKWIQNLFGLYLNLIIRTFEY